MDQLYASLSHIPDRLRSIDCSDRSPAERTTALLEFVLTTVEQNAPRMGAWMILRPMLSAMRSAASRASVTDADAEWLARMLLDIAQWIATGTITVPSLAPIASDCSAPPEAEKPTSLLATSPGSPT